MQKTKKLYILLTRFPDKTSRALSFFAHSYYTHASIGLEEDMNTYYSFVCRGLFSFVCRGFIVEKIDRYNKPERAPLPCRLFVLSVSEKTYARAKRILAEFEAQKKEYRYARFGALMSLLHIPFATAHHYFCSQFVAKVLEGCQAVKLTRRPSRYLPWDLAALPGLSPVFEGNLVEYAETFSAVPAT